MYEQGKGVQTHGRGKLPAEKQVWRVLGESDKGYKRSRRYTEDLSIYQVGAALSPMANKTNNLLVVQYMMVPGAWF